MPIYKPCLKCGELCAQSYCDEHTRTTRPRTDARRQREATRYDHAWRKLSRKARALSPVCEQCGRTSDLTTEHTPEAVARLNAGLPVRLEHVTVLCRSHNSARTWERGAA